MSALLLAHLGCAALFTCDQMARAERLRLLALGAGTCIMAHDALRCNLLADAGAAITPMRLGGEPARIAGMRLTGIPLPVAFATIGWEVFAAWPVLLIVAIVLAATCAPEWWQTVGPELVSLASESRPALTIVATIGALAMLLAHRMRSRMPATSLTATSTLGTAWRRMPLRALAASVPLTAVNIACRTALLPMLAFALPDPPAAAALWFGSFLLVYGQLVLPTPAGIGAVEIGFLGGAAGELGGGVALLLAWRWWSNILPALLGALAAWHFGRRSRGARRAPA